MHAAVEAAGQACAGHGDRSRGSIFPAVQVGSSLLCSQTCAALHAQAKVAEGASLPALRAGLWQVGLAPGSRG